jgi:hypothetical protein
MQLIHSDTLLLIVTAALGLVCCLGLGGATVAALRRLRIRGRAQAGGRAHAVLDRDHTGENARGTGAMTQSGGGR